MGIAFAQTLADSLGTVATAATGPTLLDQIASMLAAITPIVATLVSIGLVAKYAPFAAKFANMLIPFLNAVVAFFMVFAGPAPAHAGIFGDFAHALGMGAKLAGSAFLSVVAKAVYEAFFRGPLERAGVFASGLSKTEMEAKRKLVGI